MAKIKKEVIPKEVPQKTCGIIMPISAHPDYPNNQWSDVLNIIKEAVSTTEFKANLVSDADAVGLIHERIVTNIYSNDIVVCDVSSKNPNVMFELGLRLAFDKPVIIIKDDKTAYSFDTGIIEHLSYPSSLRFAEIVTFKSELAKRITATHKKSLDEEYSPFLKSLGKKIVPSKIGNEEISETKYLIDELFNLKSDIVKLRNDLAYQNERKNTALSTYGFNPVLGYDPTAPGYKPTSLGYNPASLGYDSGSEYDLDASLSFNRSDTAMKAAEALRKKIKSEATKKKAGG